MTASGRFEPFNWRDFDPGELPDLAIRRPNEGVGPENSVHRRKAGFRFKEGGILESGYAYRVAAIKGQNIEGEIGG
jgi:hypothetical protein